MLCRSWSARAARTVSLSGAIACSYPANDSYYQYQYLSLCWHLAGTYRECISSERIPQPLICWFPHSSYNNKPQGQTEDFGREVSADAAKIWHLTFTTFRQRRKFRNHFEQWPLSCDLLASQAGGRTRKMNQTDWCFWNLNRGVLKWGYPKWMVYKHWKGWFGSTPINEHPVISSACSCSFHVDCSSRSVLASHMLLCKLFPFISAYTDVDPLYEDGSNSIFTRE